MHLCIDIGNTRIKWGVFDGDTLVHQDAFERNYESKLAALFAEYPIDRSISSSTRQKASSMERLVSTHAQHTILDHTTPVPIENLYETPETLGRDRLAAVIAAAGLYPSTTSIVIDAGTCITYDVVNSEGQYLGGNIAPGARMRLEAMHHFTDGLPLVDMKMPSTLLGTSTTSALQNGAVQGTIMEIESFTARVKEVYGGVNVILTGGDADFFGELLNTEIFVKPSLVLQGLNEILKYNA